MRIEQIIEDGKPVSVGDGLLYFEFDELGFIQEGTSGKPWVFNARKVFR